ncbi:MAG TPA: tRNA epoxyqueuosine(34) reductase QueG [Myxococcota bacterium]|nr:tRNA epoxyqueuosine(34) reductase QueG [Myxococcota bacterium]
MLSDRLFLEQQARACGFSRVRIATADVAPDAERYEAWLEAGYHGSMHYLEGSRDLRLDARKFLAGARSVVVLSLDYGQLPPPDPGGLTGKVACYAWGRDYHNLILKRLRRLRKSLEEAWPGLRARGSVDLLPVYERAWAKAAGLGWIGKNCCAILPSEGSTFFLATLMLDRELPPDLPMADHCGRCRRCLDGCPTDAFLGAGSLDARRCISYLTIEHHGSIPLELRPKMGRWLFGCDVCQEVCPHVRLGKKPLEEDFFPRHAFLPLGAILQADDQALLDCFEGSPIRRACPELLRRNACVVLGNIGDHRAAPLLEQVAQNGSPLLQEHAIWALERCT